MADTKNDGMTEAEREQADRRAARAANVSTNTGLSTGTANAPVPIDVMLAQGVPFTCPENSRIYRVTPFSMGRAAEGGEALSLVPTILIAMSLSYDEGEEEYSLERTAANMNKMLRLPDPLRPDVMPMTAADVDFSYNTIIMMVTEETQKAMLTVAYLALVRRQQEITMEEIGGWLDIPTFVDFLRAYFKVSKRQRDRF